ncbi:1,4-alpha-glucan branching enzyme [Haloferula luteola]|uniref:1,4-alpha-glucan branching enzyme n=1 Tax=Haloferula luteola TaxID=595692 RepID=A0A840V9Z1_9BACT|nr:alpha-amylase family glycosyl hydrolase [Haloferula luteola]MBB5350599.1 1,4-alpha-glucan branching enzyme [Haloferula luteola]
MKSTLELEGADVGALSTENEQLPQARGEGLGALVREQGVDFRVWAPYAEQVWVTGDFCDWADPGMELVGEDAGHWSGWVPEAAEGQAYKFRLKNGEHCLLKADPRARVVDPHTGNSKIYRDQFDWEGVEFEAPLLNEVVIYELHIGTFAPEGEHADGTFDDVIGKLDKLVELGVNAIELMPPTQFPGMHSWGYNVNHPFAVEDSYGGPDGLKRLVKESHRRGIAVILDVVYNHFGPSELDLWQFDGWSENGKGGIYFYNDWRSKTPWGDTRPDYGRPEVRQYLRDNALMWVEEFRVDGLRLDAVAFIRTVDVEVPEPEEIPEGWQVMQWINKDLKLHSSRVYSIAEDIGDNRALTTWIDQGGGGFDTQWEQGFVFPLKEMIECPDDAGRDADRVAEAIGHAPEGDVFRRVVFLESHDMVANGRSRTTSGIDGEAPQGEWAQRRALLGAAIPMTSPGVPMLFQGQEFLEDGAFDDHEPLDWSKAERFEGIRAAFRDLIRLRRNLDMQTRGLCGQHTEFTRVDAESKVLGWHRWDEGGPGDSTMVVMNLTAQSYDFYELPFPAPGSWKVRFNADWEGYSEAFSDVGEPAIEVAENHLGALPLPAYGFMILSQERVEE